MLVCFLSASEVSGSFFFLSAAISVKSEKNIDIVSLSKFQVVADKSIHSFQGILTVCISRGKVTLTNRGQLHNLPQLYTADCFGGRRTGF